MHLCTFLHFIRQKNSFVCFNPKCCPFLALALCGCYPRCPPVRVGVFVIHKRQLRRMIISSWSDYTCHQHLLSFRQKQLYNENLIYIFSIVEQGNVKYPEKEPDSSGKAEPRVILGRWNVVVTIILAVGAFLGGLYFESQECKKQTEYLKQQLMHSESALEYSKEPKCALKPMPGGMIRSVLPHFLLTNYGPGCLDDVWLKEAVFLVNSEGVHECPDLPHFEYVLYCGSPTSMGSLDVGEQKRIDVDPCWTQAFDLFSQKFPGQLVSRFRLTGTALATPEFRKDFFFIIDDKRLTYIIPDEYIGGKDLVDTVIAYTYHGPKSHILWFSVHDFYDFFKNPSEFFYKSEEGRYISSEWGNIPAGAPFVWPMHPSLHNIEATGEASVKKAWSCDEKVGPIFRIFITQSNAW